LLIFGQTAIVLATAPARLRLSERWICLLLAASEIFGGKENVLQQHADSNWACNLQCNSTTLLVVRKQGLVQTPLEMTYHTQNILWGCANEYA